MYVCVRGDNDAGAIRLSVLGRQPRPHRGCDESHSTGGELRDHLRGYAAFWLTASLFRKRRLHRCLMRCRVVRSAFQPPGHRGTTSSAERHVSVMVSARTDGSDVVQHAKLAWPQARGVPYFFRNTSTRPAVSTIFCRPVKNGWQLEQTATRRLGTVERVCSVAPQVHVISVSIDTG